MWEKYFCEKSFIFLIFLKYLQSHQSFPIKSQLVGWVVQRLKSAWKLQNQHLGAEQWGERGGISQFLGYCGEVLVMYMLKTMIKI